MKDRPLLTSHIQISMLIALMLSCSPSSGDDPWLAVIEGQYVPSLRSYAKTALDRCISSATVSGEHHDRLQTLSVEQGKPWQFDLAVNEGSMPAVGWAYPAPNASLKRRIRFWRTSRPEHVDRLLDIKFSQRRGNLQWTKTEYGFLLKSEPEVRPENNHQVSYQDQHLTVNNDLLLSTSALISDEFPTRLKELLPSDAYAYYVSCRPDGIPVEERTSLLATISLVANTRLQQRDDEDDVAYALRRLRGEVILETIRAALFDVDTATFWTRWPVDGESSLTFGGTVAAKEGSTLASLFQSIRGHDSAMEPGLTDDILASCKCSVSLTKTLGISADPVVRFVSDRFPQYMNSATAIAESGGAASLFQLSDTPSSDFALRGFIGPPAAVRNLQSEGNSQSKPVDLVDSDAQGTQTEAFTLKLGGQTYQQQIIHSRRDDALIQLELNTAGNEPEPSVSSMAFSETAPYGAILSVRANLLPGNDRREEAVSRLRGRLTALEKIVFMSMVEWKLGHLLRKERRRPTRFAEVFVPLSSHLDAVGDWSFELNLYAEGPNLIVRGSMGRELHQAILAQVLFADSILSDARIVSKALW